MSSRHLLPTLTSLLVVLFLILSVAAHASQDMGDDLVFDFPPMGLDDKNALAIHLEEALNFTPEYVLGVRSIMDSELAQAGDNFTLRYTFQDSEPPFGPADVVELRFRATPDPVQRPENVAWYAVSPADFPRGFDLADGARVIMPPGAVTPEASPEAMAEALARAIGVPPGSEAEWREEPWDRGEVVLFGTDDAVFRAVCDCTVLKRADPGFVDNINRLRVAFFDGQPVMIDVSMWIDLERSGAISIAQGEAAVRAELQEEADVIESVEFRVIELDAYGRLSYEYFAKWERAGMPEKSFFSIHGLSGETLRRYIHMEGLLPPRGEDSQRPQNGDESPEVTSEAPAIRGVAVAAGLIALLACLPRVRSLEGRGQAMGDRSPGSGRRKG